MRGVIWDNRCTLHRATPFPSNDHKREIRGGSGTLQVLQSEETQQQSVTILRCADPRQKRPDPAYTQHRKLEFFAG
jgi:Taurine catabolism dioxygenase TauD, TfdA family